MSVDWYKYDKDRSSYVFNHRSENENEMMRNEPPAKTAKQRKAWAGCRWYKELVTEDQT